MVIVVNIYIFEIFTFAAGGQCSVLANTFFGIAVVLIPEQGVQILSPVFVAVLCYSLCYPFSFLWWKYPPQKTIHVLFCVQAQMWCQVVCRNCSL